MHFPLTYWQGPTGPDPEVWTIGQANDAAYTYAQYGFAESSDLNQILYLCSSGKIYVVDDPTNLHSANLVTITTDTIYAGAWSPTLGLYALALTSGTGNRVATSPDGYTWTLRSTPADNVWYTMLWDAVNSCFISTALSGATYKCMRSTDGVTWAGITTLTVANNWKNLRTDGTTVVALSDVAGSSNVARSTNGGVTWSYSTCGGSINAYGLGYNSTWGLWVITSHNGSSRIYTSSNLTAWTARGTGHSLSLQALFLHPTENYGFATPASAVNAGYITTDGITWTYGSATPYAMPYRKVGDGFYSNLVAKFIQGDSTAQAENYRVLGATFDHDGAGGLTQPEWYFATRKGYHSKLVYDSYYGKFLLSQNLNDILTYHRLLEFDPDTDSFSSVGLRTNLESGGFATDNAGDVLFVGDNGFTSTTNAVYTTNLATWTGNTWVDTTTTLIDAAYSPTLALWVAGTDLGVVGYSSDGLAWSIGSGYGVYTTRMFWSTLNSMFVALGYSGTRLATSTNGTSWTSRVAATYQFYGIAESASLMVAVGANTVHTSTDGVTWTARTPADTGTWRSVCWSTLCNCFVAVASTGTNRIMYSADGITWTPVAAPAAETWYHIGENVAGNMIFAVAYAGTSYSTMFCYGA